MKINKHTPRKLPPTHRSILPDTIAASAMSILASDTYIREIERAKSLRILLAHFQEFETTDIFLMLEEPTIHLGKTITLINILMERAKNNASIYDKLIIYFWRETDLKLCEEMLCCFRDHLIQNKKSQHLFGKEGKKSIRANNSGGGEKNIFILQNLAELSCVGMILELFEEISENNKNNEFVSSVCLQSFLIGLTKWSNKEIEAESFITLGWKSACFREAFYTTVENRLNPDHPNALVEINRKHVLTNIIDKIQNEYINGSIMAILSRIYQIYLHEQSEQNIKNRKKLSPKVA